MIPSDDLLRSETGSMAEGWRTNGQAILGSARGHPQRLDDKELASLIDRGESLRVEFKRSLKGNVLEKVQETVCAFANDLSGSREPGIVVIGVTADGKPSGLSVSDRVLRTLTDIQSNGNILPPPTLTVEKRTYGDHEIALIVVEPSDSPPVRCKGVIHVRRGPRRGIATAQDEAILNERRRFGNQPFDVLPIPGTNMSDLDLVAFKHTYLSRAVSPEALEANDRSTEEQLAATKMIASVANPTPTILGMLVLGKNPREMLPGAYVQFLRVNGTELWHDVVDSELIDGPIGDLSRRLIEKLRAHNRVGVDLLSGPIERRIETYPVESLQQLTTNAIMHRTYEATNAPVRVTWFNDRVEIINPGGPFGTVTAENFGNPGITDYRNPNLAEAMKNLGIVQKFGVSIIISRKLLQRAGHPEPMFEFKENFLLVTIKRITCKEGEAL